MARRGGFFRAGVRLICNAYNRASGGVMRSAYKPPGVDGPGGCAPVCAGFHPTFALLATLRENKIPCRQVS